MDRETPNAPSRCHQSMLAHADSTTTTDGEMAEDERRKSPRVRCTGRTRVDAPVTVHAPWASEDTDGEESDCHDQRPPSVKGRPSSPRSPTPARDGPDAVQRYVRLQEEHVEASVFVLTNGIGSTRAEPMLESLPKGGGKLTFNLTPEQLGVRNTAERTNRARKCLAAGDYLLSTEKMITNTASPTGEECPRKSSLRRSSAYSNQSEMDKQLALDQHPDILPGGCSGLACEERPGPVAATSATGTVKMMLMMIPSEGARPEDVNGSRASVSSRASMGGPRRAQHKFDEISTIYDHFPTEFLPEKFRCGLCQKLMREPRVLDCLHTFCRPCLERAAAAAASVTHGQDSALFWQRVNESASFDWDLQTNEKDAEDGKAINNNAPSLFGTIGESRFDQLRASFQSFREQNCLRSPVKTDKGREKVKAKVIYGDSEKVLVCPTCNHPTELPAGPGGVGQLPQHFVLARKIENIISQHVPSPVSSRPGSPTSCASSIALALCELCSDEVTATASCQTCALKLCNFCKEAHRRQRGTASHGIVRLGVGLNELMKVRPQRWATSVPGESEPVPRSIKCPMHPEHQLNLFCTSCHQVICGECSTLLHRDHRCTTVARAGKVYGRFVRGAIEQTRPLEDYALQSVGRLNDLTVRINGRCEAVQQEVDAFVDEYVAALEEHRRALAEQIGNIRQAKMEMIMAQKLDLECRSQNARAAIEFAEELLAEGSDVENLLFVSILLKRFEECLKPTRTLDSTVTDTIQFLADEEAPTVRVQTGVPLFGIVTTQKADPRQSGIEHSAGELATLKAHKRVQLTLVVRDYEGRRLGHGGITVQTDLRFRDDDDHSVAMAIVDNRDGSYGLTFVPPRPGVMHLTLFVDGKMLEECPVVLRIHKLRPHYGVYHCCSFCSSGGSKGGGTCACGSIMPGGYRGCGHGHEGHPGQRHWSCCGSLQEYSDCTATAGKDTQRKG
ncbi:tripartite motif-containing protein 45 [Anopheles maculipalpis]|uniref:tripartite motif-containing protein 45 n=1 Tax=Anopheles maculipalpis TaxID=1496333 RepID=UPI002158FC8B|nr:tripartite motif-containing protein 45 [Anopheles maculipalpis]